MSMFDEINRATNTSELDLTVMSELFHAKRTYEYRLVQSAMESSLDACELPQTLDGEASWADQYESTLSASTSEDWGDLKKFLLQSEG